MNNRVFITVIIVSICIIVVPLLIVLFSDDTSSESGTQTVPTLELTLSSEEPDQVEVTVNVVAKTDDSAGIESITLPDGSNVFEDNTTYAISENGEYEFSAKGKNGKSTSSKIEISNVREISSLHPYIPEGFTYSTGDAKNGYTIIDEHKNEYVWIPIQSGELKQKLTGNDYKEIDNTALELIDSVKKYFGFYIAKYEASVYPDSEEPVATTRRNRMPWTNVNYLTARKAAEASASTFGYTDCKTALMNSYAWDTTLSWLDSNTNNYSTNPSFGNYSSEVKLTGTTIPDRINNICDIAGNVKEWTTQIYREEDTVENVTRIVRGGGINSPKTADGYSNLRETLLDSTVGFRMILYKPLPE